MTPPYNPDRDLITYMEDYGRDWEQRIVRAENAVVWIIAPWFALWRIWRHP